LAKEAQRLPRHNQNAEFPAQRRPDQGHLRLRVAVCAYGSLAQTQTRQRRSRKRAVRNARLPACHSIGEGDEFQGGTFAANLTRVGEKDNYDYLVRWVHNARERTRPYCPYEKKDIGPEDYKKKGLPYVFDLEHSSARTTVTNCKCRT